MPRLILLICGFAQISMAWSCGLVGIRAEGVCFIMCSSIWNAVVVPGWVEHCFVESLMLLQRYTTTTLMFLFHDRFVFVSFRHGLCVLYVLWEFFKLLTLVCDTD